MRFVCNPRHKIFTGCYQPGQLNPVFFDGVLLPVPLSSSKQEKWVKTSKLCTSNVRKWNLNLMKRGDHYWNKIYLHFWKPLQHCKIDALSLEFESSCVERYSKLADSLTSLKIETVYGLNKIKISKLLPCKKVYHCNFFQNEYFNTFR